MRLRRRLLAGSLISLACALGAGAGPASAAKVPVAAGTYEADLALDEGGSYVKGLFSVAKLGSGRRAIVPTEGYAGIYYPDGSECTAEQLPLLTTKVPINRAGRFKVTDTTELAEGDLVVTWSGRWKSARRAAGKLTVASGRCTTSHTWTARRTPKPK